VKWKQIRELKRLLGEKTLEVDFFKGTLQKVEARRRTSDGSGEKVSIYQHLCADEGYVIHRYTELAG
jgi:hypothetical protein